MFQRSLPSGNHGQLLEITLHSPPQRDHCVVTHCCEYFQWLFKISLVAESGEM